MTKEDKLKNSLKLWRIAFFVVFLWGLTLTVIGLKISSSLEYYQEKLESNLTNNSDLVLRIYCEGEKGNAVFTFDNETEYEQKLEEYYALESCKVLP